MTLLGNGKHVEDFVLQSKAAENNSKISHTVHQDAKTILKSTNNYLKRVDGELRKWTFWTYSNWREIFPTSTYTQT
eukprot:1910034-Karenia_brevis.AAC.1